MMLKFALMLLSHADDLVKAGKTVKEVGAVLKTGRAALERMKKEKRKPLPEEWDELNARIKLNSKRLG